MAVPDQEADLRRYLRDARDALMWKLEGLSEHDVRRPLVPSWSAVPARAAGARHGCSRSGMVLAVPGALERFPRPVMPRPRGQSVQTIKKS